MPSSPKTGLVMFSPSEAADFGRARWAEQRGYDSVWLADGGGRMHALTAAGGIAAQTERITVGLGVMPVFTHTPAVLAAAATALSRLAPGRVVMGLGASTRAMMEGWHGIPFEKPLTRVRETAQLLRRMLAGEKVAFQGKTLSSNGFRLNPPPSEAVPIYLAALRPRMVELAGEIADGVIFNLCPLRAVPGMLKHLAAGAARSGRTLADLDVAARVTAYVTTEPEKARENFRVVAANYYSTEVYNKYLAWCGYEAEAARISEGFRQRDRDATLGALSDQVCEDLAVIGPAEKCREQVAALREAGINTIMLFTPTEDPAVAEATLAAFAPASFAPG